MRAITYPSPRATAIASTRTGPRSPARGYANRGREGKLLDPSKIHTARTATKIAATPAIRAPLVTALDTDRRRKTPTISANPTTYAARASSATVRRPSITPTRIPVAERSARVSNPRNAPLTVGKVLRSEDADLETSRSPSRKRPSPNGLLRGRLRPPARVLARARHLRDDPVVPLNELRGVEAVVGLTE